MDLFAGPHSKDYGILVSMLGSPYSWKLPHVLYPRHGAIIVLKDHVGELASTVATNPLRIWTYLHNLHIHV